MSAATHSTLESSEVLLRHGEEGLRAAAKRYQRSVVDRTEADREAARAVLERRRQQKR